MTKATLYNGLHTALSLFSVNTFDYLEVSNFIIELYSHPHNYMKISLPLQWLDLNIPSPPSHKSVKTWLRQMIIPFDQCGQKNTHCVYKCTGTWYCTIRQALAGYLTLLQSCDFWLVVKKRLHFLGITTPREFLILKNIHNVLF